jgi:predicted acylesterase/phospholipase RssA
MTQIDNQSYWDGGLFDNTPLRAVLDRLDPAADVERTVYVVNLFPNKGPVCAQYAGRNGADEEFTVRQQTLRGPQAALPV